MEESKSSIYFSINQVYKKIAECFFAIKLRMTGLQNLGLYSMSAHSVE